MITVTDNARERLVQLIEARGQEDIALRLEIAGRRGAEFQYDFGFVGKEYREPGDVVVDAGDFNVLISADSAADLKGASLDFVELNGQAGFKVENPNPVWPADPAEAVRLVIEKEVNPSISSHGGSVSLLEVDAEKGIAYVQMGGGCQGCGMAAVTLKAGVESRIKEAVPSILQVIDTTDHAAGQNPYFEPADSAAASPFGA